MNYNANMSTLHDTMYSIVHRCVCESSNTLYQKAW